MTIGLVLALRREVLLQPLPQQRRVDPDDIVGASVIVPGAPEDGMPQFLFVDLIGVVFQDALTHVQKQIAQACRSANVAADRDSLNQELTDVYEVADLTHFLAASF